MILPFNLKIGQVSLEIEASEQSNIIDSKNATALNIYNSWNSIKEIVDKHMETSSVENYHFSRDPKAKLMMLIFNALNNPEYIDEKTFVEELLKTNKFSDEAEAIMYVKSAVINGIIQEIKQGIYRKAK